MKTLITKTIKIAYALILAMLLSNTSFSQAHVTMSMRNITATSNTIEYDLYIVNDGNINLRLSACSYGINYDASILNGGTISVSNINKTRDEALNGLTSFSMDVKKVTDQIRMTTTPSTFEKASELVHNVPLKIGRFRITNSVEWTKNSNPSFSLQEQAKVGFTTTQIVGYVGGHTKLTALTPSLKTVSVYVEEAPILNPTKEAVISTIPESNQSQSSKKGLMLQNNQIKIYPNPAMGELNIELSSTSMRIIKVRITDMNGHIVRLIQTKALEGNNLIKIDLSELVSGMYAIQIVDNNKLNYSQTFSK